MRKAGLLYWMFFYYVRTAHGLFYRKYVVKGREHLIKGRSQLIGANHPNGLMDSLAIIFAVDDSVAWLARGDIFKKKRVNNLLRGLRMVPVYRPRDGKNNMYKNEETFQEAVLIVNGGIPLALFPEASQMGIRRLRSFKTGLARIALQPEMKDGLIIVPFGLNYSDYLGGRNDLLVNIGAPLNLSDYDRYDEDEKRYRITEDLKKAISQLMIDLPEEDYGCFHDAFTIIQDYQNLSIVEDFDQLKRVAAAFHDLSDENRPRFKEIVSTYKAISSGMDIHDLKVNMQNPLRFYDYIFMLVLSPLILVGWLINFIPYRIADRIARKPQDGHMYGTVMQGMYLVLFPLFYLMVIGVLGAVVGNWYWMLILPVAGIVSLVYVKKIERLFMCLRRRASRRIHSEKASELNILADRLLTALELNRNNML